MSKILRLPTNWLLVGVIAIGGLAALLGVASQAIWTDTDPVGGHAFGTGSVSLTAADTPTPMWNVTAAAPGTIDTGEILVTNAGTLELRYAVTGSNTDATLAAGINLRIGLKVGACDFPYHTSAGADTALTDDTELFTGTLNTAVLMGSTTPGPDAGDRVLASLATETLCFSVVLPDGASNTLQSLSTVTTFTFESEQTLNNP